MRVPAVPPAKVVPGLVKDGFGKALELSCVVLSALTVGVNGPGVFQTMLMLVPETVAVMGDADVFNAVASAEATSEL